MSVGTKLVTFICASCNHSCRFGIPDRQYMRETAQTKYADDPLTIPGCARCAKVYGALPAMYPVRYATSGGIHGMSAFALEYQSRWTGWLSAGAPLGHEPFRVVPVTPTHAL